MVSATVVYQKRYDTGENTTKNTIKNTTEPMFNFKKSRN